ncbi:hypothetical protein BY458DRAFT_498635 [Sporodiniella umbellata]|nr:hypothetical protein BY458DRAFT_498635 [Sporodiniella umbellata]
MLNNVFLKTRSSVMEQLKKLNSLVQSVNGVSSTLQKRQIIIENPDSHPILKRIYNSHTRFHVTSKSVLDYLKTHPECITSTPQYQTVDLLLETLSSRALTGHKARKAVAEFYKANCQSDEVRELFWRVIDRNLKMGVSEKTVRLLLSDPKEFSPSAIKVALANTLKRSDNLDLTEAPAWFASQKLDGVRCLSLITSNQDGFDIQFLSRSGRPFNSLQKIAEELKKILKEAKFKEDFVLDGEICSYREDDSKNEVFIEALSQIRRLKEDMKDPVYHVFDWIPMDTFFQGKGELIFSRRQKQLKKLLKTASDSRVRVVRQRKLHNLEELNAWSEKAAKDKWEGLMLRRDTAYEGKRTPNLLKVKEWEDNEYIVKSIETSFMRISGTGENKCVLKSVNINHKDCDVSVGSGFTMDERIKFAADPSLIIGKTITVQYFSESLNKKGTVSLRFPTVKAIYEDGERDL